MGKVIGIDLGTTNSAAAFPVGGGAEMVRMDSGGCLMPSMVAFSPKGERLVGNPARAQSIINPGTVYLVKRLMGKRFSEIKHRLHRWAFPVEEGADDTVRVRMGGVLFTPEEVSAMILEALKEAAEKHLGESVDGVVITVPAYFNDSQRQATRDAGEIAGLKVQRIINEPTAAALALSANRETRCPLLVYDFGGGTLDISVLDIRDGVIEVLAAAGNVNLGGSDLDHLVIDKITGDILRDQGLDLRRDLLAMQRIRDEAERAKKELSALEQSELNLPFIADPGGQPVHYSGYLGRREFEKMIAPSIEKTLDICGHALKSAGIERHEVAEVILVGGSTRIPLVRQKVGEFFGKAPGQKVNPDEIVAMGAAIQGEIMNGQTRDMILLDVIPISLGVKTHGEKFTPLIAANRTIPTNQTLVFSTVEDNQEEVEIMVYQGEHEDATKNKLLGKFTLTGILPARRGENRIEVKFSVDVNGILTVTANDLGTCRKKEMVISDSGLLGETQLAEIKRNFRKEMPPPMAPPQDLPESDSGTDFMVVAGVNPGLKVIRKEILNHVFCLEEYVENIRLPKEAETRARSLIKQSHEWLDSNRSVGLEILCEELSGMVCRLDGLVAAALGLGDRNMGIKHG